MAEKMVTSSVTDVLENDKPILDQKLYTPSDFGEIVASSHDTDILSSLLDGKRENVSATFDSWIVKLLENGKTKTADLSDKIKMALSQQLQDGLLDTTSILIWNTSVEYGQGC